MPAGLLIPSGTQVHEKSGKNRVDLTCALCHATVVPETRRVIEGASNTDRDTGLRQAFATNSAAMFRQTGVNPTTFPLEKRTYIDAAGQKAHLPDPEELEDAADVQFLAWPPGNCDSSPDNKNSPAQDPSSSTFDSCPLGTPAINEVIKMPKFPEGSVFILDGLMASLPGFPVDNTQSGA